MFWSKSTYNNMPEGSYANLSYLKVQNVSLRRKNFFLATCYLHTSTETMSERDIQFPGLFNFWTFQAKKENNALTLRKANLYSTAISSITAIFSCVQNN